MTRPASPPATPDVQGWGWHLFRVTGLVLFLLLPIHVVSTLVVTDVADWSAATVAERWSDPTWRVLDWAFVVLGLTHGGMGLTRLVGTGVRRPAVRTAATTLIAAGFGTLGVGASLAVLGVEVP